MSITELIKSKRFAPGKGVAEPPPERGIRRFFFLLSTHPWRLMTLNLLFLAFCIPVITIPAALCGVNRVLIMLVREGNCFLWNDFWREFKGSFFKSLPFGMLSAFLLFDSYYALSLAVENGMNMLLLTVGIFLLGFAVLFSSYAFVLLSALALKNRHIARNAFILMMTEWKTNLVILGSTLAMAFILAALFPYSLILPLFIQCSFLQLIVCTAVNEPLQRRIIGPYTK